MREIIAGIFICMGTIVFALSLLGIYRLKYVMNRMHAAAMGDTMGLGLVVIGLIILGHDVFHIAKYILVILFFWMSSPIASHMIGKVEMLTTKGCMANEYGSQYNHTNAAGGIFDCQCHWGIGYKKFVYCGNCFYGVQLHHGNYLGIFTVA